MDNKTLMLLLVTTAMCINLIAAIISYKNQKSLLNKIWLGLTIGLILPLLFNWFLYFQFTFLPKLVHTVELDLSSSDLGLTKSLRDEMIKDGIPCAGNICTMKVKSFEHKLFSLHINKGESNEIFCADCDSPISFSFSKMEFVAYVKFFPVLNSLMILPIESNINEGK